MAFTKRTWLARIGTGLNKFIIGEKDANDKQTLVNSPDSVTQQGDVISADNLNDLEDRIADGFDDVDITVSDHETRITAIETEIEWLRLTRLWRNTLPNSTFSAQTITLNGTYRDIVVEYSEVISSNRKFAHIRTDATLEPTTGVSLISVFEASGIMAINCRGVKAYSSNGVTSVVFGDAYQAGIDSSSASLSGTANSLLVPYAIYMVYNIYNR